VIGLLAFEEGERLLEMVDGRTRLALPERELAEAGQRVGALVRSDGSGQSLLVRFLRIIRLVEP
jgi:hypothetical protein